MNSLLSIQKEIIYQLDDLRFRRMVYDVRGMVYDLR